jgi:hypothetical protein
MLTMAASFIDEDSFSYSHLNEDGGFTLFLPSSL